MRDRIEQLVIFLKFGVYPGIFRAPVRSMLCPYRTCWQGVVQKRVAPAADTAAAYSNGHLGDSNGQKVKNNKI